MHMKDILIGVDALVEMGVCTRDDVLNMNLDEILDLISVHNL